MKICIVPARGGSKLLPRKNMFIYKGKPTVQTAVVFDFFSLSGGKVYYANFGCDSQL
jgi:hypothetical protein